jgi:hypothetical protein
VLTVSSANVSASAGQSLQVSNLVSATDANNDALLYYLYDGTTNPNSGHFVVNGTVMQAGVTLTVTATQLAQTTFVAGTVSDVLFVQATDTQAISNTGRIEVNVGTGQQTASAQTELSAIIHANARDNASLKFDQIASLSTVNTAAPQANPVIDALGNIGLNFDAIASLITVNTGTPQANPVIDALNDAGLNFDDIARMLAHHTDHSIL